MSNPVVDRLHDWYLSADDGQEIQDVFVFVQHLFEELYTTYEPSKPPKPDFWQRLDLWLNSELPIEQQKLLFRLIPHIFFIGREEYDTLYRIAFNTVIGTWLIDQLGIVLSHRPEPALKRAVANTWICPITDSMRINGFYHVNGISGHTHRPDWRTLTRSDPKGDWIRQQISLNRIERIVLVEDFVGSGSQIKAAVRLAASLQPAIPVLIIPLVCCPDGEEYGKECERKWPHLRFRPVITLSRRHFLNETRQEGEPALFNLIRPVVNSTYGRVTDGLTRLEKSKLYGPFGFEGTGGLVVLWTNCPDNTVPLVHRSSESWGSLFPRASRL